MEALVSYSDTEATVRLRGRFDFGAHREFREATEEALGKPNIAKVNVDLSRVDYLDSSALGMLLLLRDKAKAASREVMLSNCSPTVRQVLDVANFGKLFTIV